MSLLPDANHGTGISTYITGPYCVGKYMHIYIYIGKYSIHGASGYPFLDLHYLQEIASHGTSLHITLLQFDIAMDTFSLTDCFS